MSAKTSFIITELEIDAKSAIKILRCLKKHEPEIFQKLSEAVLPILEKKYPEQLTDNTHA